MQTPSRAISRQPIYASTPFQKNPPVNLQQELDAELVCRICFVPLLILKMSVNFTGISAHNSSDKCSI